MPKKMTCLLALAFLSGLMCASSPVPSSSAASSSARARHPSARAPHQVAEVGDIEVVRASNCLGVADREPVDPTDQFSVDDGRAYTWCEIVNGDGVTLQHVYYHEGIRTDVVDLPVRSDRFRTWSYKTLRPGRTGDWRVDLKAGDTVLLSLEFAVGPGADVGE